MPERFFVGIDLGQISDFTAISIAEQVAGPPRERIREQTRMAYPMRGGAAVQVREEVKVTEPTCTYQIGYLERAPLGTPYPNIVEHVTALLTTPPLTGNIWAGGNAVLVVDYTGVGRPIVDLLRKAETYPVAVSITGGTAVTTPGARTFGVPKRDLVAALQVGLQSGRLKIAAGLKEAAVLTAELVNFRMKQTTTGQDTYEAWREGQHDDLVLAVAIAIWYGERRWARREVV